MHCLSPTVCVRGVAMDKYITAMSVGLCNVGHGGQQAPVYSAASLAQDTLMEQQQMNKESGRKQCRST